MIKKGKGGKGKNVEVRNRCGGGTMFSRPQELINMTRMEEDEGKGKRGIEENVIKERRERDGRQKIRGIGLKRD